MAAAVAEALSRVLFLLQPSFGVWRPWRVGAWENQVGSLAQAVQPGSRGGSFIQPSSIHSFIHASGRALVLLRVVVVAVVLSCRAHLKTQNGPCWGALFATGGRQDDPWGVVRTRALEAGRLLAAVLLSRPVGSRPVTLLGFSMGAKVCMYIVYFFNYMSRTACFSRTGGLESLVVWSR